ncbi:hypothetical protein D1872_152700 [compost metagenome]
MALALFGNKQQVEEYEPQDVLVILQEDGTAAIAPVVETNEERIYARSMDGSYTVPKGDVKAYTGPRGRIFMYPTTVENVQDCQRLAALERSIVLRQITHFEPEYVERKGMSLGKIMLIAGGAFFLFILLIVAVAK